AEFVENDSIAVLLRRLGVDYGQGYHFQVPEPLIEQDGAQVIPLKRRN
ncbi:MAG TPA: EAL domain-containing protein, partial [Gammaproteobacteria bacterium]|nr:EAL domain-containing protein [Gammaproteobacteria bacterium]